MGLIHTSQSNLQFYYATDICSVLACTIVHTSFCRYQDIEQCVIERPWLHSVSHIDIASASNFCLLILTQIFISNKWPALESLSRFIYQNHFPVINLDLHKAIGTVCESIEIVRTRSFLDNAANSSKSTTRAAGSFVVKDWDGSVSAAESRPRAGGKHSHGATRAGADHSAVNRAGSK